MKPLERREKKGLLGGTRGFLNRKNLWSRGTEFNVRRGREEKRS